MILAWKSDGRLTSNVGNVVALWLLTKLVNGSDVFRRQLHFLEVLVDAGRGDRFGDNTVSAYLRPGEAVKQTWLD